MLTHFKWKEVEEEPRDKEEIWPLDSMIIDDPYFNEIMRLNGISYKFSDGLLSDLKFRFSNGIESEDLEAVSELIKDKPWKHIEIDVNDILTKIEVSLDSQNRICSLKLRD